MATMPTTTANRIHNGQIYKPPVMTVDFSMPEFFNHKYFPDPATKLPNGWLVSIAEIGPELAERMLSCNSDVNRKLRVRCISRYTSDIQSGFWRLTHQGIAFDRNGQLVDGQHRLRSVVESQTPFNTLVFFGVGETQEMAVLDTGAARSANDAASVHGIQMHTAHSSIIRLLFDKGGRVSLTHSEIIKHFEEHADAVSYAAANASRYGCGVAAGVAAAWYHCDTERLDRFLAVASVVVPATEPGDRSAITLHTYLTDPTNITRTRDSRRDMMLKTMRAIHAYMNGEDLKTLRGQITAYYHVPVDAKRAV